MSHEEDTCMSHEEEDTLTRGSFIKYSAMIDMTSFLRSKNDIG
jgi:hypothetical protein